jgi:hypothetical protein
LFACFVVCPLSCVCYISTMYQSVVALLN